MKFAYFREEWQTKPEWIAHTEDAVFRVWKDSYCGYSATYSGVGSAECDMLPSEPEPMTRWDRKRQALQREENTDMMEIFQRELPLANPVPDIIRYWASKSCDPGWKDLSRMALEYLSIPAMSAEPERVFSGAKISLSHRRCSMGDDALEALECLKSWQRDGLVAATREDIKEMEEMLAALCEEDLQ